MVKAVLTTKAESIYDDLPEERYHFPRTYLNAVQAAVGDWIFLLRAAPAINRAIVPRLWPLN